MRHSPTGGCCIVVLFLMLGAMVPGCKRKSQEMSFALEEVSAFEVPPAVHWDFTCGQAAQCTEQPDPNVTAYPPFASKAPLFGSIHLPHEYHRGLRGQWYHFALDESGGTGQGYDRLCFDLNCDLDLANDTPVRVSDHPPPGAFVGDSKAERQVCFDCLGIPLPFGAEGMRPLKVMPRLVVDRNGDRLLTLVTTRAFRGEAVIAGPRYDVWLGHNRAISGWFDRPSTAVHLVKDGDFRTRVEASPNWLMEWRRIGGTDYRLSATPSGDRLMVSPYRGPYGTLKISPGDRGIGRARMSGALYSGEALVWIGGKSDKSGRRKAVRSFQVPVGDYTAGLEIYLGDLHLSTAGNIHADGRRAARGDDPPVLGIKIRKDKPFVLDLSARPEVLFASPGDQHWVARGQELRVEAALVDPELDLMVTDLERGRLALQAPDDNVMILVLSGTAAGVAAAGILWLLSYCLRSRRRILLVLAGLTAIITLVPPAILYAAHLEREYNDISPRVTITRSDGEIVAAGIMPFG
jgi:hypothetical protein